MKIRYNKSMGIGVLAFGVILIILACVSSGSGSAIMNFISGSFLIWYGLSFLTRTCFFFDDTRLEVYHPLVAGTIAKYELQSLKDIEVDNTGVFSRVFLNQNGERERIQVSTWMVDKKDWQVFLQKIQNA